MSVEFIKWNQDGLCGAACVHMALHALKPSAFDTNKLAQDDVWTSIKDHTHGQSTMPCCSDDTEPFPMMRGARPGATCAICWWSYPIALRATLIEKLGNGTPVVVRRPATQNAANDIIRSCLDRSGVPIVLVDRGFHWVVVAAWNTTTQKIKLFDPANPGPTMIKVGKWNVRRMKTVDIAGAYDNKHVVVEVG